MSSQPRLVVRPTFRVTELVVDVEELPDAVERLIMAPAVKAWSAMMADLAAVTAEIMRGELPVDKHASRVRSGPHIRDTVEWTQTGDNEWWIGPGKMVDGIPLGLLLEKGTKGGTVIKPRRAKWLRFVWQGRRWKLPYVIRGATPPNNYAERSLIKLGRVAYIEERFWYHYSRQPEVIAAASAPTTVDWSKEVFEV